MAEQRITFEQWRPANEGNNYPFEMAASLTNGTQFVPSTTFIDLSYFPVGGKDGAFLAAVEVAHDEITLWFGDLSEPRRASATFDPHDPPDNVAIVDTLDRPAGLIVSEALRLSVFAAWGVGTHVFTQDQTSLVATCCWPQPAEGVRGVLLDDGTLLTGDVWLVGSDGVVLRHETVTQPPVGGAGGEAELHDVIRVDVVGDPLVRRRLCDPLELFETPKFVRTITFTDGVTEFTCGPGDNGDVKVTLGNTLASDTILRVRPQSTGVRVEAVGTALKGVR